MDTAMRIWNLLNRDLWLVTAQSGSTRGGLIATFVNQASIVPALPRVVVGLAKYHHTHGVVASSRAFALHLLGEDQIELVWRFGLNSGKDKFDGLECQSGVTGAPILPGAVAWLECRVENRMDTGDRTLWLGEVVDAGLGSERPILTAKRMLELASADQRKELRRQMDEDAQRDSQTIVQWRIDKRPGILDDLG